MTHEDRMHADDEIARSLRTALSREETPDAWVRAALAIPRAAGSPAVSWRGHASRRDLADVLVPAIAGAVLVTGLAVALLAARGPLAGWLSPLPHAGDLAAAVGFPAPSSNGDMLRLAILTVVLPPAGILALAESVRGFPLLRRWFA